MAAIKLNKKASNWNKSLLKIVFSNIYNSKRLMVNKSKPRKSVQQKTKESIIADNTSCYAILKNKKI